MTTFEYESFGLHNYKSIKESGEIKTPGITLILGPNSSGKSNILESLRLLRQSVDTSGLNLTLNGQYVKLGEYRDIVHMKETEKDIIYEFKFTRDDQEIDKEKNHECPICNKGYKTEGYYTNHIEREHSKFWEDDNCKLNDYESFLQSKSRLLLKYGFETSSKSNRLKEIEFTNLSPSNGLFLSSFRIRQLIEKFEIIADDLNGERIVDLDLDKDEIGNDIPNLFMEIPKLINMLLYQFIPREPKDDFSWRYAYRIPSLGDDDQFATIHKNRDNIEEILQEFHETEEKFEQLDEMSELAIGLLGRITEAVSTHGRQILIINSLLREMTHVGPLRRNPQRIYFGSGGSPGGSFSQGDRDIEEMIFRAEQSEVTPLLEQTNEWLEQTGFDVQLEVSEVGVGDLYQLQVLEDGLSVNLADSGFGLSQTLPIIVQAVNMENRKEERKNNEKVIRRLGSDPSEENIYLTLIEQPEIHLNPKIEAAMGDFFINVMKNEIDLMLETHSEHLLNRIQRRVADDSIEDPSNVSIYFVSKDDKESNIKEINISSAGRFDYWPEGFFQDDFDEAIEILKESLPEQE